MAWSSCLYGCSEHLVDLVIKADWFVNSSGVSACEHATIEMSWWGPLGSIVRAPLSTPTKASPSENDFRSGCSRFFFDHRGCCADCGLCDGCAVSSVV